MSVSESASGGAQHGLEVAPCTDNGERVEVDLLDTDDTGPTLLSKSPRPSQESPAAPPPTVLSSATLKKHNEVCMSVVSQLRQENIRPRMIDLQTMHEK